MSGFLSRGLLGARVGYGLYFTTTRLFGVDPGTNGGSELSGTLAGYIDGQLMPEVGAEESARIIAELERVRDFELAKDAIVRIELKQAGSWGIGFGRIAIVPVSGETKKLQLRSRIAYDRLLQLTQRFHPDVLRTKPFLSL